MTQIIGGLESRTHSLSLLVLAVTIVMMIVTILIIMIVMRRKSACTYISVLISVTVVIRMLVSEGVCVVSGVSEIF